MATSCVWYPNFLIQTRFLVSLDLKQLSKHFLKYLYFSDGVTSLFDELDKYFSTLSGAEREHGLETQQRLPQPMADQLQRILPILHGPVRRARLARVRPPLPDKPRRVPPRVTPATHHVASQRPPRRHGVTPAALPRREA